MPNGRNEKDKRIIQPPPPKIFLLDQLVQKQGVLSAALVGDLYFWIAKAELHQNKNPWKLNCDYASWFNKNVRTIGRKLENLYSIGWLDRKRTRHPKGYLWSYEYSKAENGNSKVILDFYKSFIKNEFVSKDLGDFDPYDNNAKQNPTFQILHTDSIKELGNIDKAYVLDRLSWIFHSREDTVIAYRSYNHLSAALNMKPKKVISIIEYLEKAGLLRNYECSNGYRNIDLNEDGKSFQRMSEYLYEHMENRTEGLLEDFKV